MPSHPNTTTTTTNNNNLNGVSHHPHHRLPPPPSHHPPPPPPRHHYHTTTSSSCSCSSFKGCCCCLFLLLIFLALLAFAVALVVVLVVKPKKPQFDLHQVAVTYLLVTQSPPSSSAFLSLNITMSFVARNPNKVGIKYHSSAFYVLYKGVPLGFATFPSFYQPAHSTREIQTHVAVRNVNVLQADALDLIRDATVNDRVELRVTGDIGAKIRVLSFTSPNVQVSVDCAIVISPRKQSLTYKQCGVDGVNV